MALKKILGLGEILWDLLPEGKKLGGAPTNFAYFANVLGQDGVVASKIGKDPLGKEIVSEMEKLGLASKYIQTDKKYPTGTVGVELDKNGQPDYIIYRNVAWDHLELNKDWEILAKEAKAICFGTLAQRSKESKETINNFLNLSSSTAIKFLDLNIRQDFFSVDLIIDSIRMADMLKLNTSELKLIRELLKYPDKMAEKELCLKIIDEFELQLLCLTRGEDGSLILNKEDYYDHPGYKASVMDTIGAGDAFSAAVVIQYLKGKTIREISDSANRLGAWVSSRSGPTPRIDKDFLSSIKEDINGD